MGNRYYGAMHYETFSVGGNRRMMKSATRGAAPPPAAIEMDGAMEEMEAAPSMQARSINDSNTVAYSAADESNVLQVNQQIADSQSPPDNTDFSDVKIRKNLEEMAFFMPHLKTNEKGEVIISFTTPESLTKWKFQSFAHTKDLSFQSFEDEIITQKDLMVMPKSAAFFPRKRCDTFCDKNL